MPSQAALETDRRIERTHPAVEYIGTPTSTHLAHEPARFVGSPHDLFDRHAPGRERQDIGILRLAAKPSGMLAAFRCAQSLRIDNARTDSFADRHHRPLHGGGEGRAGVFHQVPPVSDLNGVGTALRGSLPITGASIPRDDGDRRTIGQPSRRRRSFSIRQNVDDAPAFQVTDDRPVAVTALSRKVIDTDHTRFVAGLDGTAPDNA